MAAVESQPSFILYTGDTVILLLFLFFLTRPAPYLPSKIIFSSPCFLSLRSLHDKRMGGDDSTLSNAVSPFYSGREVQIISYVTSLSKQVIECALFIVMNAALQYPSIPPISWSLDLRPSNNVFICYQQMTYTYIHTHTHTHMLRTHHNLLPACCFLSCFSLSSFRFC